jgi:hypothetical protein
LAQIGQAQTSSESIVYQGEQHLTPFMVNPANSKSLNPQVVTEPDRVTPNAAAPGLSSISTWNTCGQATSTSTLVCENDSNANITTNLYPTSSYKVYEVVRIIGYGSYPVAKLGGKTGLWLQSGYVVETDYLCGTNYAICTTGQTVTGFQYWYDITSVLASGASNLFYVQSTGLNNPGTTLSASLTIMQ